MGVREVIIAVRSGANQGALEQTFTTKNSYMGPGPSGAGPTHSQENKFHDDPPFVLLGVPTK